MHSRKLQLVGGSSFSVSLPKRWVEQLELSAGHEVRIIENGDGTLTLGPEVGSDQQRRTVTIAYEEYGDTVVPALFSAYYLGADTVHITYEERPPASQTRSIREAINYMSGTEIIDETERQITVEVLLDKQRINIRQLLQRMSLLVSLNAQELAAGNVEELELYEMEVDRLYHLAHRVLTRTMQDPAVLSSSGVEHKVYVPGLLMVSKRLESLSDILYSFAHLRANGVHGIDSSQLERMRSAVRSLVAALTKPGVARPDALRLSFSAPEQAPAKAHELAARLTRIYNDLEEEVFTLVFTTTEMRG